MVELDVPQIGSGEIASGQVPILPLYAAQIPPGKIATGQRYFGAPSMYN